MKAPRLSQNTAGDFDLLIENGVVPWAEDGTQAAQHAMERLLIFEGEPSLDGLLTTKTEEGTKWYATIFDVGKSRAEKELEIKRRILGTPGIEAVLEFTWSVAAHTLTITGKVRTSWGDVDISTDVELL